MPHAGGIMRFILILLIFCNYSFADSKITVDVAIDKFNFVKPQRGVGKAGDLVFKYANIINQGIILNVNNTNNYFDSQIFIRPTFLGFTTQFGNYGFNLEEKNIFSDLLNTQLSNAKLIMDDFQLNLAGESFDFLLTNMSVKLKKFRLYCQGENLSGEEVDTSNDLMKNCFNFLTLNGSFLPNNDSASMEFEGIDGSDKTYVQAKVRSFDLRKKEINLNLTNVSTVSNDKYFISANEVNMNCAKNEEVKEIDFSKLKHDCLNRFKLSPIKATLTDKTQKTQFGLDIKDITIKDKLLYFTANQAVLSNTDTVTVLNTVLLNCKKDTESDPLDVMQVLKDCISYSRISIADISNNKRALEKSPSTIQNIIINSDSGRLNTQAVIRFLGFKAKVTVNGQVNINEAKKQIILTITDTKLPLGITSVKLLMYFLKKDLISKNITIQNNVITINL